MRERNKRLHALKVTVVDLDPAIDVIVPINVKMTVCHNDGQV